MNFSKFFAMTISADPQWVSVPQQFLVLYVYEMECCSYNEM